MQNITNYVYEIILKQVYHTHVKTVQFSDHFFQDLDLDSLDIMQILSLLEKKYDIIFPDRYIDYMQYVYELVYMLMLCIINRKLSYIIDFTTHYCVNSWKSIIQSLQQLKQKLYLHEQKILTQYESYLLFAQHKHDSWQALIDIYEQELQSLCSDLSYKKIQNKKEITLLLQMAMFKINTIEIGK